MQAGDPVADGEAAGSVAIRSRPRIGRCGNAAAWFKGCMSEPVRWLAPFRKVPASVGTVRRKARGCLGSSAFVRPGPGMSHRTGWLGRQEPILVNRKCPNPLIFPVFASIPVGQDL